MKAHLPVPRTPGQDSFEAVYLSDDGTERRVPLALLAEEVETLARPVRSFPSYKGQRNYPGWYWSATMGATSGTSHGSSATTWSRSTSTLR
ncbi:hypothetical protein GCM10009734_83000 [Nonomuraea bangladeshensis]